MSHILLPYLLLEAFGLCSCGLGGVVGDGVWDLYEQSSLPLDLCCIFCRWVAWSYPFFFLFRLFLYNLPQQFFKTWWHNVYGLFLIVSPEPKVSLCKASEENTVAGNKDGEDATVPSCSNGHDGPSTSSDCQKEARVRNTLIWTTM